VEIAKGLLAEPEFILMDEPGTGLDPGARESFWDIVRQVNSQSRTTFLITTHLMEEAEHCHRVGILDSGDLVKTGKPDKLKKELGSELVEIQSGEVQQLAQSLESAFDIQGKIIDDGFFFQHESGHRLIPKIIESYPGLVEEVAVRRPTLSDVFRHHTGKTFEQSTGTTSADE
jgi:ABC-2 type transport system ATP-binding protein